MRIEEADYIKTIESLLSKKANQIEEENTFVKREKLTNYIIQKGFEPELVWSVVKEVIR